MMCVPNLTSQVMEVFMRMIFRGLLALFFALLVVLILHRNGIMPIAGESSKSLVEFPVNIVTAICGFSGFVGLIGLMLTDRK